MSPDRDAIAMIGFGSSAIERRSDRGIAAFALDAAVAAIADAGIERDAIDGYVGAPWATNAGALHAEGGDELSYRPAVRLLGITGLVYGADLYRGFPTDMVITAAHALRSGDVRYVLGLRALYNPKDTNYATAKTDRAYGDEQFIKPFGYSAGGARFATRQRRYMALSGASRRDLYEVTASSRRHAAHNPLAIWKDRMVSLDEYMAAPMIASPHCLFDCDMPVCGAAAFVMTTTRYLPEGCQPVYVRGWSGHQKPHAVFEMSGLSPGDIDQCQLYDGFSSMIYEWLETFGWCEPHQAWKYFRDGHAERDGKMPVNSFGGSLGEGRLHGMGHLREGYLQVAGRAGERQLAASDNCLIQVGPYDSSSFVILSRSPGRAS
jgi:acetyl-CoA acetyltransferase